MKKIVSILLMAILLITMALYNSNDVYAGGHDTDDYLVYMFDSFEYSILTKSTAIIVGYSGSDVELEIPESINGYTVTSIGHDAFSGCSSLKSITIPESVTSIGSCAFRGCSSLETVTIPESVINIGSYAFEYCRSLKSITIPSTVTSIGSSAFDDTAFYNDSSNWVDGVLYIDGCLIHANENIEGSYEIINGTHVIASSAFEYCRSLKSITIPSTVISIGSSAFEYCSSLESITIPKSVTSIGEYAFPEGNKLAIYGYNGSCAEVYAKENDIRFIPISSSEVGDISGNGIIDANDSLFVLKYVAKLIDLSVEQAGVADVNADGNIDPNDALMILKYVARLIESF